ncbi:DUF1573 domain-containing protein [Patescibacteria group bacterium]|nr:MAG: DUF1573 domain-containing protein [Patescibacteria group bacterium]
MSNKAFRAKKIKSGAWFVFAGLVLAALIWLAASSGGGSVASGNPRAEITPAEIDAGTVSMAAGKITKTFTVKNAGTGDLVIDNVWTSCHCTTAYLIIDGKKSSRFGMDKMSTFQKIGAGKTAELEVVFDPAYHGRDAIGAVNRIVYLSTNDSTNKVAQAVLLANVTR